MYSRMLLKQCSLYRKRNIDNCIPNAQKHVNHLYAARTKPTPHTPYQIPLYNYKLHQNSSE